MSWFHPIDKHLLFTRNDKEDPRLGECVQLIAAADINYSDEVEALTSLFKNQNADFAIMGFPDDEGISLNGGRVGAQNAPREIRTYLYKMTPHLSSSRLPRLLDMGDLIDKEKPLAERHERARQVAREFALNKQRWISLGGGHDYGYCDGAGFLDAHAGGRGDHQF